MMLVELHHCVRAWWTLHMMHSVPSCSFLMTCTLKTFKLCLLKQNGVFCTKDRRGERVALFEGVHEVLRAMNWEIYCVLFVSFRYSFIQLTAEMGTGGNSDEKLMCNAVHHGALVGAGRAGDSWRPFDAETRLATESRLLYDLRLRSTFNNF